MDWNYILDDAKFYSIEVAELVAYVLLIAVIAVAIEAVVARIRGRKRVGAQPAEQAASERTVRSH